jgi:hypothetical protein
LLLAGRWEQTSWSTTWGSRCVGSIEQWAPSKSLVLGLQQLQCWLHFTLVARCIGERFACSAKWLASCPTV